MDKTFERCPGSLNESVWSQSCFSAPRVRSSRTPSSRALRSRTLISQTRTSRKRTFKHIKSSFRAGSWCRCPHRSWSTRSSHAWMGVVGVVLVVVVVVVAAAAAANHRTSPPGFGRTPGGYLFLSLSLSLSSSVSLHPLSSSFNKEMRSHETQVLVVALRGPNERCSDSWLCARRYLGDFDQRKLCRNPKLVGENPVTGNPTRASAGCQ